MTVWSVFDEMELCSEQEVRRMIPSVSAFRSEQALRYKHPFGRFCCLKSWLMLEQMVRERYQLRLADYAWRYNAYGKPYLSAESEGQCLPFFSISHCKAGIAVVLSDEETGIDIEGIRRADASLIPRVMNEAEQALIARSGVVADRVFTRLWTQKEAVLKAEGTGIRSFEHLQSVLEQYQGSLQTFEKENYIYSIANGRKLHCVSPEVPSADV